MMVSGLWHGKAEWEGKRDVRRREAGLLAVAGWWSGRAAALATCDVLL
jgi:hypothetical protein